MKSKKHYKDTPLKLSFYTKRFNRFSDYKRLNKRLNSCELKVLKTVEKWGGMALIKVKYIWNTYTAGIHAWVYIELPKYIGYYFFFIVFVFITFLSFNIIL